MKKRISLKSMWFLLIFVITFSVVFTEDAIGKNKNINFKSLTIENGLSQNSVSSIFQDSEGYMWFGTSDGLNKYDGYNFESYKFDRRSNKSIAGSYIADIAEDFEGNIWIATSKGVSKIEKESENIKNYFYDKNDTKGISHYNIWNILVDSKGRVWIGTENGLNLYDKKNDSFIRFYKQDNDNSLSDNFILSLDEDDNGVIWIGTKNGLNSFDYEKNRFTQYLSTDDNLRLSNGYIYDIYCDKNQVIWAATRSGGLNRIDLKNQKITYYKNDGNISNKKQIPSNGVRTLKRISTGELLIGTDKGLCKYNEQQNEFIIFEHKVYDNQSIVNNDILSLYEDRTGLIWVGTYDGINMFNPNTLFTHYKLDPFAKTTFSDKSIMGIYEDDDGLIWFGTIRGGLNCLNRKTGEVKSYTHDPNNPNSISNNAIWHVNANNNEEIWVSTLNGLNKFDKKTEKFTRYYVEDGLSSNETRYIYFDSKDNMWIGSRNGLTVMDPDGNFKVENEIFKSGGLTDEFITSIYEDSEGNYWIGAALNGGVLKYNRETGYVKNYISDENDSNSLSMNSIKCIKGDVQGNIWIATNYGLNKLDPKTETFTAYTESEGLSNNFVYGILIDDEQNPWVSTNSGISKLDIKQNKFIKFNVTDGLQSNEFNTYTMFKSKSGEMFFGGINGFNSFFPKDLKQDSTIPKVVLGEVFFNGIPIKHSNKIELKYNENHFNIEFFLPDYKNIARTEYSYKLEGFDKYWVYSKNRNHANYTNIPSGQYEFKVKARNTAGIWSEETTIPINIMAPPWKTPLAYIIYILIITLIIWFIWNYVKILEKMVDQRTMELNRKLEENKSLYNKLIQTERYKNNYFINLSHELRTPLNVVLSTVQLLNKFTISKIPIENCKMLYYLEVMNKNSNRLLKLINNIIDTSKIDSGSYKIQTKKVDIVYLVEEVALSMKEFIEGNGIELIIDPEIEEKEVECDTGDIERCIVNLIGNAVKFTEKGGLIEIKIFDRQDKVDISVRDTGMGIEPKYHESIFNRFSQAYDQSSEEHGGSGLGLTLTMQLIKLHNGNIKLKSEVGKGSEFIITIPVAQHR